MSCMMPVSQSRLGDAVGEKTLCPGLVYYRKNNILADYSLAQLQARKSVSCYFVYILCIYESYLILRSVLCQYRPD